jgi:hypothetical protein
VRYGDKWTLKRVLGIGFKKGITKTQISTGGELCTEKWTDQLAGTRSGRAAKAGSMLKQKSRLRILNM